jgi:para-nitrobenzyl esterase
MKNTVYRIVISVTIILFTGSSMPGQISRVEVEGGTVEGTVEGEITIFKGIPFAAPPIGELRWKAPQPVIPWEGVRMANRFAPQCPQVGFNFPGAPEPESSEDCLYLNIWTPAVSGGEKLPVMVWIHGGGFALGSTSAAIYHGDQLAQKGVVVVSIAYRLGPLGYMCHPELSAESERGISGNYGLLDQIEGLKWIQKNIAAFGGDPGNVTIFGESAGGISVSMLCASPLTGGLFQRAISESGGNFGPVEMGERRDGIQHMKAAERTGLEFAERMGAGSIGEMRNLEPSAWMEDPLAEMGGFWPVADGYVLIGDQYELYAEGKYNDVDVIIGTNSDEGGMFVQPTSPEIYKENIRQRFEPFAEQVLELYPGDTEEETHTSAADIFRETVFAWPSWAWARLQSRTGKSNVFVYYFDQQQQTALFSSAKPRGAGHGAEIAYVFQKLNPEQVKLEDLQLSEHLATYWTNFARTGDPNGGELPRWPSFKEEDQNVMYLNSNPSPGPVPNLEKLELMEAYFNWRRGELKASASQSE